MSPMAVAVPIIKPKSFCRCVAIEQRRKPKLTVNAEKTRICTTTQYVNDGHLALRLGGPANYRLQGVAAALGALACEHLEPDLAAAVLASLAGMREANGGL